MRLYCAASSALGGCLPFERSLRSCEAPLELNALPGLRRLRGRFGVSFALRRFAPPRNRTAPMRTTKSPTAGPQTTGEFTKAVSDSRAVAAVRSASAASVYLTAVDPTTDVYQAGMDPFGLKSIGAVQSESANGCAWFDGTTR